MKCIIIIIVIFCLLTVICITLLDCLFVYVCFFTGWEGRGFCEYVQLQHRECWRAQEKIVSMNVMMDHISFHPGICEDLVSSYYVTVMTSSPLAVRNRNVIVPVHSGRFVCRWITQILKYYCERKKARRISIYDILSLRTKKKKRWRRRGFLLQCLCHRVLISPEWETSSLSLFPLPAKRVQNVPPAVSQLLLCSWQRQRHEQVGWIDLSLRTCSACIHSLFFLIYCLSSRTLTNDVSPSVLHFWNK